MSIYFANLFVCFLFSFKIVTAAIRIIPLFSPRVDCNVDVDELSLVVVVVVEGDAAANQKKVDGSINCRLGLQAIVSNAQSEFGIDSIQFICLTALDTSLALEATYRHTWWAGLAQ